MASSPKRSKTLQIKRNRVSKHKRGTSVVERFFLEPEDGTCSQQKKRKKKFHSLKNFARKELDAEALTKEERLSRLLHTPKPKIKLPESGSLFDHFVVVGSTDENSTSPKILFKYPNKGIEIPGLAEFCFPSGVSCEELPDSTNRSEQLALLYSQSHLKQPENNFVFLFTKEDSEVYYGVCVNKVELFDEPAQYIKMNTTGDIERTTTRCYCLITKFPFFRLHFDFLFSLFSVEHLKRLENQTPAIIEQNKDEREIFLSPQAPSKKKLTKKKRSHLQKIPIELPSLSKSASFADLSPLSPRNRAEKKLEEIENSYQPKPAQLRRIVSDGADTQVESKGIGINQEVIEVESSHPCIDAMARYQKLTIPQKGQTVEFLPNEYLNSISFSRPFFDEEEELFAEWGIPLTLCTLSFPTLCSFISAILLEKKILVYSNSLRILSALVFSFPPLIKPFVYQSVIIPMLPDKMENFLEAPVPFVVGTIRKLDDIPPDVVVLDATKDEIRSPETIEDFPQQSELKRKCFVFIEELLNSFGEELPFNTTKVQRQLVDSICTIFETHFDSLFSNFHNYTICNMSDPGSPISIFMKESFLEDIEEDDVAFIEPFIETQAFLEYCDHRLRTRDSTE